MARSGYITRRAEGAEFADAVLDMSAKLEEALEWIANHYDPNQVFAEDDLDLWARNAGYIMPGEEE